MVWSISVCAVLLWIDSGGLNSHRTLYGEWRAALSALSSALAYLARTTVCRPYMFVLVSINVIIVYYALPYTSIYEVINSENERLGLLNPSTVIHKN